MSDERSPIRPALRTLAIPVYFPVIAGTVGIALMIPVLPLYLTRSGFSLGLVSIILAGAGIGATLGGLPAGALIARWGERLLVVVGETGPTASVRRGARVPDFPA